MNGFETARQCFFEGLQLLVFYEANATMNLFSTARKEVPYPKEADERLKEAFRSYFASLLASRP